METKDEFTLTDTDCNLLLVRQMNKRFIEKNAECQQVINKLREIEVFLRDFGFLTFGRDFVFKISDEGIMSFARDNIMTSLELTMGSVIACCESACIADANTLLRKYRDDLFFSLYIAVYNSIDKSSEKAKRMALQITKWINNELKNFSINDVLKEIATAPQLREAVKKYNLEKSFGKIRETLNNYVHSNGYAYYNRDADAYKECGLVGELRMLENKARYLTVVFLLLLVFCSPLSVMSEDYIDYLENGVTPPDGSQYWVAPFVEEFVKENISLIDANCLDYLRENSTMQF